MKGDNSRFWIIINPEEKIFGETTTAIVDEEAGGIIAYLASADDAQMICTVLDQTDRNGGES